MLPQSFKDRQTPPQRKRSQRDLGDSSLNFEESIFLMRKLAPDSSAWYEQFHRVAASDNADGFRSDEAGKQPQHSVITWGYGLKENFLTAASQPAFFHPGGRALSRFSEAQPQHHWLLGAPFPPISQHQPREQIF